MKRNMTFLLVLLLGFLLVIVGISVGGLVRSLGGVSVLSFENLWWAGIVFGGNKIGFTTLVMGGVIFLFFVVFVLSGRGEQVGRHPLLWTAIFLVFLEVVVVFLWSLARLLAHETTIDNPVWQNVGAVFQGWLGTAVALAGALVSLLVTVFIYGLSHKTETREEESEVRQFLSEYIYPAIASFRLVKKLFLDLYFYIRERVENITSIRERVENITSYYSFWDKTFDDFFREKITKIEEVFVEAQKNPYYPSIFRLSFVDLFILRLGIVRTKDFQHLQQKMNNYVSIFYPLPPEANLDLLALEVLRELLLMPVPDLYLFLVEIVFEKKKVYEMVAGLIEKENVPQTLEKTLESIVWATFPHCAERILRQPWYKRILQDVTRVPPSIYPLERRWRPMLLIEKIRNVSPYLFKKLDDIGKDQEASPLEREFHEWWLNGARQFCVVDDDMEDEKKKRWINVGKNYFKEGVLDGSRAVFQILVDRMQRACVGTNEIPPAKFDEIKAYVLKAFELYKNSAPSLPWWKKLWYKLLSRPLPDQEKYLDLEKFWEWEENYNQQGKKTSHEDQELKDQCCE